MKGHLRLAGGIMSLIGLLPFIASAQQTQQAQAGQSASPARSAPTAAHSRGTVLSDQQLDQLTAPIALYADPLVGQILMAATYPLEVVEAQRWLEDPVNAAVKGEDLVTALNQESWDPSIKSLVQFPQILEAMSDDIEWTEEIGEAFLSQQGAVMDSIQRLRHRAAADGVLLSTPQQTVSTDDQDIAIEPTDPMTVYVPYYDPTVVYGPWPWAEYPPSYFPPPVGVVIGVGVVVGFGAGCPVVGPLWGWNRWNWGQDRLYVAFGAPGGVPASAPPRLWQHDPSHRRGVPYRDPLLAARYRQESDASRRIFSGFSGLSATTRAPEISDRVPELSPRAAPTRTPPPSRTGITPAHESIERSVRATRQPEHAPASHPAPSSTPHGDEPSHH